MSGRVSAVAAFVDGGKTTVYVGAASGGVWKSLDGGTTFKPVFDKQAVQSIGAIAIDPSRHDTVWVGSGESWTRNSVSIGDGIYKSTDGGTSWTNVGLGESERITRIVVHPTNGDVVYACVPGKLWSDSADRGVYKTTDGGKTWALVLKGSNLSTGCSGLAMDPKDPEILFAGTWDFRRRGWTYRSGGEGPTAPSGSRLYRTTDGGKDVVFARQGDQQGSSRRPLGSGGGCHRAIRREDRLRIHRVGRVRAVRFVGRRRHLGAARQEPQHGVETVLFRAADRRPDAAKPRLQAGSEPHRERRRGKELCQHRRTRARRLARPLDRSDEHQARHRRRRRRTLELARRRQPLVEIEQPSHLAILPRQRRRQGSLPGLRRAPGQQLLGRRLVVPRRYQQLALGEPLQQRRLLGRRRPDRSAVGLRRGARRLRLPHRPQNTGGARHPAQGPLQGEASLQLEHAHLREPHPEGHHLHRLAVPVPLARSRRHLGAHLPRSYRRTIRRSRSRSNRVA